METRNNNGFPHEYQESGPEEVEELKKYLTPVFTNVFRVGAKGYFFYHGFKDVLSDVYNLDLRSSDTFVLSFQRSGTTWTQELVWLLQNNLDFEASRATPLTLRFPHIEAGSFLKLGAPEEMTQSVKLNQFISEYILEDPKSLNTLPSPRFLKSHLPMSLLPPSLLDTAMVVYVARDPRDVVVSSFFHMKSVGLVLRDTEFKSFWNLFIQDKILWCPYFENVKEAWNLRNHPNMTFIFYEELSKDLPAVARRLAAFFGKQYSDEQYQALSDHLKFDNFKNNASVNMKEWRKSVFMSDAFIRKGKSGGWREHFDAEMTRQAESWINENLRDTDLRFPDIQ